MAVQEVNRYTLERNIPGDNVNEVLGGMLIPSLPLARSTSSITYADVLSRFTSFLQAIHDPNGTQRLALLFTVNPAFKQGVAVEIAILCADRHPDLLQARDCVGNVLQQIKGLLPNDENFDYGHIQRLSGGQLQQMLFPRSSGLTAYELRKFVERHTDSTSESLHTNYLDKITEVPGFAHPWRIDPQHDPVRDLIELLSRQQDYAAVLIQVQARSLPSIIPAQIAGAVQGYNEAVKDGVERKRLRAQRAMTKSDDLSTTIEQASIHRAQALDDEMIARARRGSAALSALYNAQTWLFDAAIRIISTSRQAALIASHLRAKLATTLSSQSNISFGWQRSELRELKVDQVPWLTSLQNELFRYSLPYLTPAEELAWLFHLPVFPAGTQTNAVETANVPFLPPPSLRGQSTDARQIRLGFVFDRAHQLRDNEDDKERKGITFSLDRKIFVQPSVLVGAPGSGKTNLALHLLKQWWGEQQCPFLVIDPSTGQEFRYLIADKQLERDLVVFSVGDEDFFPLRFNPLAVPPGVPVRSHINRLIGCFKAAYEMWDPLPTVYEGALLRTYRNKGWQPNDKGGRKTNPTLSDFAIEMNHYLEQQVKEQFDGDAEGMGRIAGSSKIRVNGLRESVGHIIDIEQNDPAFFQRLLEGPTVIELGALGDQNSITLLMAFLLTQLVGYIEHLRPPSSDSGPEHLIMIEEAHRLLGAEGGGKEGSRGKTAEEIGVMLAEMRKFKQGVMILDQRPSSLIGSVLDNARINIMGRLNDDEGFRRLSGVLNLNEEQQRYARTRLAPGQAIVLDTVSGWPVLIQPPPLIDQLRDEARKHDIAKQVAENAERRSLIVPFPGVKRIFAWMSPDQESEIIGLLRACKDVEAEEALFDAIESAEGFSVQEKNESQKPAALQEQLMKLREGL